MPRLKSGHQRIGKDVEFGSNVSISAKSIEIADSVIFHDDISINCRGSLKIGHHGIIGSGARIQCNDLSIGHWFFLCEGLEIGSGGCNSKEANVEIGNYVGIFERVLINPSSQISIGDNCGIGREVQIWTHGAWLDPIAGFPSDFGPVSIGENVWLPARSIVLPNSSIGDNCVIGINSIINKSIPPGSFAAGCPVKLIRADAYPAPLGASERSLLIQNIIDEWQIQFTHKVPDVTYAVELVDGYKIRLSISTEVTTFDCVLKTVEGATTSYSEDMRDYLRRRGIKIYTDDFFRSV